MKECLKIRTNEKIRAANEEVKKLAQKHSQPYIDINKNLMDEQGRLKSEYTIEGMHINENGYRAIYNDLMVYVKEPITESMNKTFPQKAQENCRRIKDNKHVK